MTLRRRSVLRSLLLICALATCACDTATLRVNTVGPSLPATQTEFVNVSRGALVQPTLIDPIFVRGGVCPAFPPLVAPFSVVIEGDGRTGRFFSHMHVQFVDRFGMAGGFMRLGRTELASRFGSIALPASGTRTFPFAFPFGCVGAPPGMLTILVVLADPFGRETRNQVQVAIR